MRVLKNLASVIVEKNVRGKIYKITSKGSLSIDSSKEDEIANDLLQTYGFLRDITPKEIHVIPKTDKEIKKVVKSAEKRVVKKGKRKHDNY